MRKPITFSLQRLRTLVMHSPGLVAWVMLSLTLTLTPCCEVVGTASAAPASVSTDHDRGPDTRDGTYAPDSDDPCAAWLDRSDVVPSKAGNPVSPGAKVALATPFVFLPGVSPMAMVWQPPRLSASPPHALYLRHLRLIL